jgi:hypothetical protein
MVKTVKKIILHPKHLTLENSLLFAIIQLESEYWLNPSWLLHWELKRETGANPVRTRRCERERKVQKSHWLNKLGRRTE